MNRLKKLLIALSAALLAVCLDAPVFAGPGKVQPPLAQRLEQALPDEAIPVIVTFAGHRAPEPIRARGAQQSARRTEVLQTLRERGRASEKALRALLAGQPDGPNITGWRSLWATGRVALQATPATIERISRSPRVTSVGLDGILPLAAPPTDQSFVPQDNLTLVGADLLWSRGVTGRETVVATLDSGVDFYHLDLFPGWIEDGWFDPYGQHSLPFDATGHGTRVMGVMVGGDAGGSNIGMAPDARWIAARIFNDDGNATFSAIHAAFQWLLDPDGNPATDDAPDVVNNSWAFPVENAGECIPEFQGDIDMLRALGIGVVFSAGNYGPNPNSDPSPPNNIGSLAVGSVGGSGGDTVSVFSSRGPSACGGGLFPLLVAPGEGIRTTDSTVGGLEPDQYATVSGTSFSAPHVAGAMALLRGAFPDATLEEVEDALFTTAVDIDAVGPDDDSGHGRLDVHAAFESLVALVPGGCTDGDGDGFFAEADCGTPADCDDTDPALNPGATEICDDGIDNNCDGLIDDADPQCENPPACTDADNDDYFAEADCGTEIDCAPTRVDVNPGAAEVCDDGIDNNCDGLVDEEDPQCIQNGGGGGGGGGCYLRTLRGAR